MRVLIQPTKLWRKRYNARRFPELLCPDPNKCHPCGLTISKNKAGFCAGLVVDKEDLDIIRLCIFAEGYDGKLTVNASTMEPDESMAIIRALAVANYEALYLTEPYLAIKRYSHKLHQQRRYRLRRKNEFHQIPGTTIQSTKNNPDRHSDIFQRT